MKKLIFLLLMAVVLVGFVSAGAAHPPGVLTLEVNYTEAAMSEYCVDGHAVTPDTVLVFVFPEAVELSSLQVVMVHNYNFITTATQSGFIIKSIPTDSKQSCTGYVVVDYYLRC